MGRSQANTSASWAPSRYPFFRDFSVAALTDSSSMSAETVPARAQSSTVTARLSAATRSRRPVAARWASSIEVMIPPEQNAWSATFSSPVTRSTASIASMIACP